MAQDSLWFRIGYALEQARTVSTSSPSRLRALAGRLPGRAAANNETEAVGRPGRDRPATARDKGAADGDEGPPDTLDSLLMAGGGALLARSLDRWRPARRPGLLGLLKGGAAGASAALLRELLHPVLRGEMRAPHLEDDVGEALLAGAARGLLYASLVEPHLPGPDVARGLVYGTAEYVVSPWGGLTELAGRRAPHRRIPLVSSLFDGHDRGEDTFADHVAFAVALAVLYGVVRGE